MNFNWVFKHINHNSVYYSKAGKPNCLRDSKNRFESYCQDPSKMFELRHTETGRFSYANQ